MFDPIAVQAERELNDPNSPYFLGRPSALGQVDNYINGRGTYNTNYLGPKKTTYLSQPTCDTVQILSNVQNEHNKNTILKAISIGALSLYCFLGLRKAHLIPKFSGQLFKLLGQGLGKAIKLITWPLRA